VSRRGRIGAASAEQRTDPGRREAGAGGPREECSPADAWPMSAVAPGHRARTGAAAQADPLAGPWASAGAGAQADPLAGPWARAGAGAQADPLAGPWARAGATKPAAISRR